MKLSTRGKSYIVTVVAGAGKFLRIMYSLIKSVENIILTIIINYKSKKSELIEIMQQKILKRKGI